MRRRRRKRPYLRTEEFAYAAAALRHPVTLHAEPGIAGFCGGGYYYPERNGKGHNIIIDSEQSAADMSRTIYHELMHAMQFEEGVPMGESEAKGHELMHEIIPLVVRR